MLYTFIFLLFSWTASITDSFNTAVLIKRNYASLFKNGYKKRNMSEYEYTAPFVNALSTLNVSQSTGDTDHIRKRPKLQSSCDFIHKLKSSVLANIQENKIVQTLRLSCVVQHAGEQYIRPFMQLMIVVLFYVLHLTVLTQNALIFPIQLFPNERGWFLSIGYDSLAGILSLVSYVYLSNTQNRQSKSSSTTWKQKIPIPSLLEEPYYENLPWSVTTCRASAWRVLASRRKIPKNPHHISVSSSEVAYDSKKATDTESMELEDLRVLEKVELITDSAKFTGLFLVIGYTLTGQIASLSEGFLSSLAGLGVPMTIAMHRSLVVLLSHLCWVFAGTSILKADLQPPFFGPDSNHREMNQKDKSWPLINKKLDSKQSKSRFWNNTTSEWFTIRWNTSWVWWAIGGYFVSTLCFNISDVLNQLILPSRIFDDAGEGVVAQLINPEMNDFLASLVGYIAPCLSAPIWEELLYRGYMLPALCLFVPFWPAVLVSGILFSVHHMSSTGFIPLWVLGMTWATIYAKCKNLWVTILIHSMWNSRVFLGGWLGL